MSSETENKTESVCQSCKGEGEIVLPTYFGLCGECGGSGKITYVNGEKVKSYVTTPCFMG